MRNGNGEEIGIIGDLNPLDEESKREVETELRLRYLIPQVTSILSIKHNSDMWNWELQTNLGPIRMSMRNLHEYIQFPSRERMLITDMVGRRCEISNLSKLDSQSTKELSKIM